MPNIPITLSGTIATDPESRTLPTGRACASFRLAVNHWRVDKTTGEFVDEGTSWFGIDCYGQLASNVSMSLRHGMAVIVQGGLKNREWETAEKKGISPTVIAEHIGPDLRFGTANYQRTKGANRDQGSEAAGSQRSEHGSEDGWGRIQDSSPQGPAVADDEIAVESSADAAADFGGVEDPAVAPRSEDGDETDSDAIARDTAAAAAPF